MTGEARTELSSSPCMAEEVEKGLFDPLASQEDEWRAIARWRKLERERLRGERMLLRQDKRATIAEALMAELDGKPVCVVVPSDKEVSMKKLASAFGGKSAAMMKPANAEKLTGFVVGAIAGLAAGAGQAPMRRSSLGWPFSQAAS